MLSIVVPVYNEGIHIERLLTQVNDEIHSAKEVIIVYDHDDDDTLPVIAKIKRRFDFPVLTQKNKFGHGALNAIKSGMLNNNGEAVLVAMADLSDNLSIVDDMFALISNNEADVVCGSRYMKGGSHHGGPLLKSFLSRMAGLSFHVLSGIPTHDVTNSFKMYRKTLLESITIESVGGFEIGMEITVKAFLGGYEIKEIPSEWFERDAGESRFRMWEWLPYYLHWYFKGIFSKRTKKS